MPMSDERKLRSARAGEMVSLPFLLLPRTPSSSLLSLPCADAQGWNSTLLDNARKFRMKFTVADPFDPPCDVQSPEYIGIGGNYAQQKLDTSG